MSKTKDENGDGGKTENIAPDTNQLLAQVMQQNAQLLTQLVENQPQKVITESSPEYQAMLKAQGFHDEFPKPVYQNGRECAPRGLPVETRERAATLQPGKYLNGKVTVEIAPNGGIHIKYPSATVEARMSQSWKDFPELIDKVWAEMHAA